MSLEEFDRALNLIEDIKSYILTLDKQIDNILCCKRSAEDISNLEYGLNTTITKKKNKIEKIDHTKPINIYEKLNNVILDNESDILDTLSNESNDKLDESWINSERKLILDSSFNLNHITTVKDIKEKQISTVETTPHLSDENKLVFSNEVKELDPLTKKIENQTLSIQQIKKAIDDESLISSSSDEWQPVDQFTIVIDEKWTDQMSYFGSSFILRVSNKRVIENLWQII